MFWRKLFEQTISAVLIYSPEIPLCNRLGWMHKMCIPFGVNGIAHSAHLLTGNEFISEDEQRFFFVQRPIYPLQMHPWKQGRNVWQSTLIKAHAYQNPRRISCMKKWGYRCRKGHGMLGNYKVRPWPFETFEELFTFWNIDKLVWDVLKVWKHPQGQLLHQNSLKPSCSYDVCMLTCTGSCLPTVGAQLWTFQRLLENAGRFLQSLSERENNKENGETTISKP